MTIYLDFDGTVVEHDYPNMGRCNFGCFEVIKKLQDAEHEIIINTYRADLNNGTLESALKLINEKHWMLLKNERYYDDDFELKPIIKHLPKKQHPNHWNWDTMKRTNEIWIDDIASGIPLKKAVMTNGNMVDWDELDKQFFQNGIYSLLK